MTQKNSYQSMMEGFRATDSLKARVLKQVEDREQERAKGVSTQYTVAPKKPVMRKKFRAWPIAVGAATALVLLALFLSPIILTRTDDESQSFGLVAYAEADSPGSSVELQTGDSTISLAGTGGDDIRFRMNLSCYGEGIESLTYTIEGTDVHFGLIDTTQPNYGEAGTTAYNTPSEFVVDYSNQNEEGVYREIGVTVVDPELKALKDEERRLLDQQDSSDDPVEQQALKEEYDRNAAAINSRFDSVVEGAGGAEAYFVQQATEAASKLGDTTLHITAKYSSGDTETKSYKITPVENFAQVFKDYIETMQTPGFDENDPVLKTPMFILSEIV